MAGGFLSLTAPRAEGCGIALRAMSIKSALRDLLSVSYDIVSTTVISHLRWLFPPLVPYGTKGGISFARQGGWPVFRRPQGGYMVFAAAGGIKNGAESAVPPQWNGTSYLPRAKALNPSGRRQPVPDRTLAAQGQRPGDWLNPHARKGVSTYGNTGKHRPDPGPDRAITPIKKAALRQQVDGN